jgi:leader peptidase (prepilin peptidase)/N-methyltransferase
MPGLEAVPLVEIGCVAAAFVCGAILGSFINVVAHRLPRGESVSHGRSRCPRCGAGIRPRDNVPVLGWLLLRGRCRDCAAAIPARYPLVEAACGGIAAIVAAAELLGRGHWAPVFAGGSGSGLDRILGHGDWQPVASWLLHVAVLLCILTWSLPEMRRSPAVCRGAALAIVGMLLLACALPNLGPAGLLPDGSGWPDAPRALQAAIAVVVGSGAGAALGALGGDRADRCSLALLGAAAGWQAVLVAGVATAGLRLLRAAFVDRHTPGDGGLTLVPACVTGMICWHPLLAFVGW